MSKFLAGLLLLLLFSLTAQAQISNPGVTVGAPVNGACTNGYFIYNNAGVVGCSGSSSSIAFPQAVTGGTSGGIPYFSSTTQLSSSALLALNALIVGGGAAGAPSTVTTGTGVLTALGIAPQTTGSFARQSGAITNGNCLQWSSTGVSDAGAACGSGGGTPSFPVTVTGTVTSGGLAYFNSTTQESSSALLAANALVIGGGAGVAPSTTTTGTGVVTALGVNTGSAGAFVVNGGALGTPSSGTLTSATGLPISTGLTGAGTGVLTALGVNVGSTGALTTQDGAITTGNCLKWGPGIQDQGTACGASSGLTVGTTSVSSGTTGYVLYNNAGTLGNLVVTPNATVGFPTVRRITSGTTDTAATTDSTIVIALGSAANFAETLPACVSGIRGQKITVKDALGQAGGNPITVKATTSTVDTIAGATGLIMNSNYQSITFQCDDLATSGNWMAE